MRDSNQDTRRAERELTENEIHVLYQLYTNSPHEPLPAFLFDSTQYHHRMKHQQWPPARKIHCLSSGDAANQESCIPLVNTTQAGGMTSPRSAILPEHANSQEHVCEQGSGAARTANCTVCQQGQSNTARPINGPALLEVYEDGPPANYNMGCAIYSCICCIWPLGKLETMWKD